MLAIGTTVMIPAGRGGNLRQYLASLERMAALDPRIAFPGHGPVIDRPIDLIRQYIAHRAMRESQILACASRRRADVDAIVTRIYGELVDPVRRAARETVTAHLEKLREDGAIELDSARLNSTPAAIPAAAASTAPARFPPSAARRARRVRALRDRR